MNSAGALAKGDYLLKIDAHCMVGQDFDRILTAECEDSWVVVPRRYNLDVDKWEVMPDGATDYDKLIILESHGKLHGEEWQTRAKKRKTS